MITTRVIKIIDLEKYRLTINLKRAKVMFFIRVICVVEIVVDANCLHDARDCFGAQGGNANRHYSGTGSKFWRSSSLRARMAFVFVVIVSLLNLGEACAVNSVSFPAQDPCGRAKGGWSPGGDGPWAVACSALSRSAGQGAAGTY